jgi:ABC-type Fe3+/spermidine/putrescine transport system ATPase subunit
MNTGRVLQADDPVAIYQSPLSSVVADFIGYRNIFPGAVRRRGDDGILFALDKSSIELTSAHPPPPGEGGVFACVRPEDFEIVAHGADQPAKPNTFIGEVTLASFMGAYTQYRVRGTAGQVIDVFHNRAPLNLQPGSPARLHVAPKAILLLPMRSAS